MRKKDSLFKQFQPVTPREWKEKIINDLKGADFSKKLIWRTGEGFDVNPFYTLEDIENLPGPNNLPGQFPFIRGRKTEGNPWLIRQDIQVDDYPEANKKAVSLLTNGIDSLGFIINDPGTINIQNFRILLADIHIEAVEINFLSNGKAKEILWVITQILHERGLNDEYFRGAIETDPLGRLMINGTLCIPVEKGFDYLAELSRAALKLPGIKTINAKISDIANSGGDIVQELAFAISIGNEYIDTLLNHGLKASEAASLIKFTFAAGSNYFFEIAKLRSARLLWSVILKGYINDTDSIPPMEIHSVTTRWNKTIFDPYVNLLRTQTEAMSAVLGGADSITVEPYDISFRMPDDFSERLARNQQLILKEEAGFGNVADPSAGSYYIEKITEDLAESAWKLFLEIEEQGGFIECLRKRIIQEKITTSATRKKKEAATKKIVLLGTNQYPDPNETAGIIDETIAFRKRTAGDNEITPLAKERIAQEYELIRLSVERSGKEKPSVFLLPIGNPAMRRTRSQFSSVFFGCAGYRIIDNNGFDTTREGIDAAHASKADIVVVCSSDEEYIVHAPEVFKSLKNKTIVVIAGNPACSDELRASGIEYFIHIKSDIPETLRMINKKLGIQNIYL
ncbi:MAG TPA: methylmalonyl-CoA mutase family protein [Bacteroidales bacterium]|nr:methylmalonyl-CoA mutase family protein [Bacteroidales bacterium]